jgi:glycosyltransferase involved in cell wall biosynthesis
MKCLLLIPAFNEEPTICRLIREAKSYVSDVLVVDDGSCDATAAAAAAAGATVRRLKKNMGKGEALKRGFRYAITNDYEWVVTMDGDGQHDPRDIASFFPLLGQYDLVLGNRMEELALVPLLRRIANRTSSLMVSALCAQPIHDSQTGFRCYNARLLRNVRLDCSHYDLESEAVIKAARQGFRIGHCRIRTIYAGEVSRFRNLKDSVRFLHLVLKSLLL